MGKRTLHTVTYYQCDYSGIPMASPGVQMPVWDQNNKLCKRGSYINWECMLAHAMTEAASYTACVEYVRKLLGVASVNVAPSYSMLKHFGGTMSIDNYLAACDFENEARYAVMIPVTGAPETISMLCQDGAIVPEQEYKALTTFDGKVSQTVFAKSSSPPNSSLTLISQLNDHRENTVASQAFKLTLHGPVLVVLKMSEPMRHRILSYTAEQFLEQYGKKRKRKVPPAQSGISTEEYGKAKASMQSKFSEFEASIASKAVKPRTVASLKKMHGRGRMVRPMDTPASVPHSDGGEESD